MVCFSFIYENRIGDLDDKLTRDSKKMEFNIKQIRNELVEASDNLSTLQSNSNEEIVFEELRSTILNLKNEISGNQRQLEKLIETQNSSKNSINEFLSFSSFLPQFSDLKAELNEMQKNLSELKSHNHNLPKPNTIERNI